MIPYLEILRGMKGFVVPHLWTPMMLNDKYEKLYKKPANMMIYNSCKKRKQIDIFVLEPNGMLIKTALVPLVASEKLNRLHPELVHKVYIYNFPTHDVSDILSELKLGDKLVKCGRGNLEEIFETCNNNETFPVFLSHHYKNSLNYLYYEILYYGYPLVHNSDDLDGCGYYYPGDDVKACADAIYAAFTKHNDNYDNYYAMAKEYLYRIDPLNPLVGKECKRLLTNLLVRGL
jgi:hypothetical protein